MSIAKRVASHVKNPQLTQQKLFSIIRNPQVRNIIPHRLLRRAFEHPQFNLETYLREITDSTRWSTTLLSVVDCIILEDQLHLLTLFESPVLKKVRVPAKLLDVSSTYKKGKLEFVLALQQYLTEEEMSPSEETLKFLARNMACLSRKKGEVEKVIAAQSPTLSDYNGVRTLSPARARQVRHVVSSMYVALRRFSKTSFVVYHKAAIALAAQSPQPRGALALLGLFEEIDKSPVYSFLR